MQPPTRREIVLVGLLVVSLVIFTGKTHTPLFPIIESTTVHSTSRNTVVPTNSTPGDALGLPVHVPSAELVWDKGKVPETSLVGHVPGWTIFDRLYLWNGTLFVVSDTPTSFPERKWMISEGHFIENGQEAEEARLPSDSTMKIISTAEAKRLFGKSAARIDGVTWLANDPAQFITHYYHWCAELFFGFWRAYSSLDPLITVDGRTNLPPPRRMMFNRLDADHWRDYANMNQLVVRAALPSLAMEFNSDWVDRAASGVPFVLDRVILADRSAAMLGYNWRRTQRTASNPFALPGSVHWWAPIREAVVGFARPPPTDVPVITYISRQGWGRRMLLDDAHASLVRELHRLRDERGYEVHIVSMDKLSRIEQLQLAGRTTIMMGVHGNGLTSLLWMRPSPRATVMEFFYPGGFAHDYEWTTRALGMVHYGFWGNTTFTRPNVPQVDYPPGFQGNEIPLDGALVAKVIVDRLELAEEMDEA